MDMNSEIATLQHIYELRFDENLYVALTLSLVASRHLVISSSTHDLPSTLDESIQIIDVIWGIPATVISFDPDHTYTAAEIRILFINQESQPLSPIYLLIGLERLHLDLQRVVLKIIKDRSIVTDTGVQYKSQKLFSVISLCSDPKLLYGFLKNEFWFEQPHNLPPNSYKVSLPLQPTEPILPDKLSQLHELNTQICKITILPDLKRYIYDLIIHFRNHRVTQNGLPTRCINDLTHLTQTLCVVFDKKFVVPTMVKLATRKYIPLHLKLIEKPELEPSQRWGGEINAAEELIKRITPEIVVEHVLKKVSPPI